MAGINLLGEGERRRSSARCDGDDVVAVTISGARGRAPRHRRRAASRCRGSRSSPRKGRATGGVRAHAFLKGEDALTLAWVGARTPAPSAPDGAARPLPEATAKRDASGQPLDAVIGAVGTGIR